MKIVKFKQSKRNLCKVARNGKQGSNAAFHPQVITMKHSYRLLIQQSIPTIGESTAVVLSIYVILLYSKEKLEWNVSKL